jgi:cytoplasmic iron level regulating protein YaaA (DUF328/UPF0246 family)
MLMVISPAKSLAMERPAPALPYSQPHFLEQAQGLIKVLSKKRVRDLQALMDLSEKLSTLNVDRYSAWVPEHNANNSCPAVLAFDGDVYQGLDAQTLTQPQLLWANDHLATLSGLYGVLRPLDWIQAHRLEMGTALKVGRAPNLYTYWGKTIAHRLNELQEATPSPELVNLASQEYFKSVDQKALKAPVIECVFEEGKDSHYKVVSFFAKRARGLMARFAIDHAIDRAQDLKAFNTANYQFSASASTATRWVFRRPQPAPMSAQ